MRVINLSLITAILLIVTSFTPANNSFLTHKKTARVLEVTARVVSKTPFKLLSQEIEEITAIVHETNKPTYGYRLKSEPLMNLRSKSVIRVESGYFYYGHCLVYGYLCYDCNPWGTPEFYPCDCTSGCSTFCQICPDEGNGYAGLINRQKSGEKYVKLKFEY